MEEISLQSRFSIDKFGFKQFLQGSMFHISDKANLKRFPNSFLVFLTCALNSTVYVVGTLVKHTTTKALEIRIQYRSTHRVEKMGF
jgi:hypothetical protein